MLVIENPGVIHWNLGREEAQGNSGLLRYRLTLRDGGQLEAFERFEVAGGSVRVTKYSFHWRRASGELVRRWDNAAHHPEIATHPDHLHDSGEENVLPHEPVNLEKVLNLVIQK